MIPCNAARTSIMTSRDDHIRTQLQQASVDIRATWRNAQSLLHSRQKVIYDDSECADLVGKFSLFWSTRSDACGTTSRRRYSSPAPGVCCTTAYRTRIIGFPAGYHRWGPEAAGVHTIAAVRPACLSAEGLRRCLCTCHYWIFRTAPSQVWFKYDLLCYSWSKCTWFLKIFRCV